MAVECIDHDNDDTYKYRGIVDHFNDDNITDPIVSFEELMSSRKGGGTPLIEIGLIDARRTTFSVQANPIVVIPEQMPVGVLPPIADSLQPTRSVSAPNPLTETTSALKDAVNWQMTSKSVRQPNRYMRRHTRKWK